MSRYITTKNNKKNTLTIHARSTTFSSVSPFTVKSNS